MRMSFHHVCIETKTYTESITFYQKLFAIELREYLNFFMGIRSNHQQLYPDEDYCNND